MMFSFRTDCRRNRGERLEEILKFSDGNVIGVLLV
jgi:hypothetical protein